MKKNLIIFILFFVCITLSAKDNVDSLLKGEDISFSLVDKSGRVVCRVRCNDGVVTCNYGTDYIRLDCVDSEIKNNNLHIKYVYSVFNLLGEPSFRDYDYPSYYEAVITYKQIINRIKSRDYKKIPDTSVKYKDSCNALIICDNLRIRESPNTTTDTKVIGKLKKWDKVTVTDCTEQKDKIDNLEYPWYKIKTEDGIEGWIFGGFAKIYFTEDDLELLHKAFEKEGSEYTNQFPTPDNS